ncbi:MAG: hypothetical protein HQL20_10285 [Candidatus Omnitrophica bacterium]|nr:hypothetical protein [Candidatus Omnitrophota bacterium]
MKVIKRCIAILLLLPFLMTTLMPAALASEMPWMPQPGVMVGLTPAFMPAHLRGMVIHPNDPFKFDFLIYRGDQQLSNDQKQAEYSKLIKYFLASLAIPDEDQWVNLSPFEKDRIIPDNYGLTEMGRDVLAQDYMLKQIAASLTNPDTELGKKFWDAVYEKSYQKFGTTDIPTDTFNKVWIVPNKAVIYEKGNTVVVLEHHLKVMLESDYVAMSHQKDMAESTAPAGDKAMKENGADLNVNDNEAVKLSKDVMREVIIPAIEKEVNEGKSFAPLRQVHNSMLLAAWYKRALKESILTKVYGDRAKVKGIDQDPKTNQEIYNQYTSAFKKGVFNMIKEDVDRFSQEVIPRKYFSGGDLGPKVLFDGDLGNGEVERAPQTPANEGSANEVAQNFDRVETALTSAGAQEVVALATEVVLSTLSDFVARIRKERNAPQAEMGRVIDFIEREQGTLPAGAKKDLLGQMAVGLRLARIAPKGADYTGFLKAYQALSELKDEVATSATNTPQTEQPTLNSERPSYSIPATRNVKSVKITNDRITPLIITKSQGQWFIGDQELTGSKDYPYFGVLVENGSLTVNRKSGSISLVITDASQAAELAGPILNDVLVEGGNIVIKNVGGIATNTVTLQLGAIIAESSKGRFSGELPDVVQGKNEYAVRKLRVALTQAGLKHVFPQIVKFEGNRVVFRLHALTETGYTLAQAFEGIGVAVEVVQESMLRIYADSLVGKNNEQVQERVLEMLQDQPWPQYKKLALKEGEKTALIALTDASMITVQSSLSMLSIILDSIAYEQLRVTMDNTKEVEKAGVLANYIAGLLGNKELARYRPGLEQMRVALEEIQRQNPLIAPLLAIHDDLNGQKKDVVKASKSFNLSDGTKIAATDLQSVIVGLLGDRRTAKMSQAVENLTNGTFTPVFLDGGGVFVKGLTPEFQLEVQTILSELVKIHRAAQGLVMGRFRPMQLDGGKVFVEGLTPEFAGGVHTILSIENQLAQSLKMDVSAVRRLLVEVNSLLAAGPVDHASKPEEKNLRGGIDFAQSNLDMQIKRDGAGVPLPISQQNLDNIRIDGLVPVILNIQPATNAPLFS